MTESRPPQGAQRRFGGGARRAASDRVVLRHRSGAEVEGWTLNVSRGGVRLVIEGAVLEGDLVDVHLGDGDAPPRPGRIAWIKGAPDGQIIGLQYLDTVGSIPPADDPP